ncbi:uncharacterized protein [Garra rufa]|uniref:uncharacterized protein n=1 Tax=Garra rufa TaxID=137080 RepID=UPI003CCED1BC
MLKPKHPVLLRLPARNTFHPSRRRSLASENSPVSCESPQPANNEREKESMSRSGFFLLSAIWKRSGVLALASSLYPGAEKGLFVCDLGLWHQRDNERSLLEDGEGEPRVRDQGVWSTRVLISSVFTSTHHRKHKCSSGRLHGTAQTGVGGTMSPHREREQHSLQVEESNNGDFDFQPDCLETQSSALTPSTGVSSEVSLRQFLGPSFVIDSSHGLAQLTLLCQPHYAGIRVALGDARMLEETSLKASHHGNTRVGPRGSDEDREDKQTCVNTNPQSGLYLQSSETSFPTRSSLLHDDLNEFSNECSSIGDLSQDASFSLESCVKLERRWMLWYEFKKEISCLDDWLRSAEKMAASPNSSHVLYVTAKEELRKYENLRAEARIRLIQLDGLTQRSRTLVGLFRGAMGARLVEMTKDCGQRWDQLTNTLETVCRRLKHFVCQREDFERQREEMAVWLADMDLRLTEVEHFSGKDTCSKMHQLQEYQTEL